MTTTERDKLIEKHTNYAYSIAHRLSHSRVDGKDLAQCALLGLTQAAENYDPKKNSAFVGFARMRIVGACKDWMRQESYGSRREPYTPMRLDEVLTQDIGDQPVTLLELMESRAPAPDRTTLRREIRDLVNGLPERERLAITLYYFEDMSTEEIGRVMGCDKSRVSQIMTVARERLRKRLYERGV